MSAEQQDGPSVQEMEMAQSVGLSTHRKFGDKKFALYGVAEKDNPKKCDSLVQTAEAMKASGEQVRVEEKAGVVAVYIRVE